jgi:hypothetical protein
MQPQNPRLVRTLTIAVAACVAVGCASTKVSPVQNPGRDDSIARPGRILVYDFGVRQSDVALDSDAAAKPHHPMTAEQAAEARALGIAVAERLAKAIEAMGIPASRTAGGVKPAIDDILIRGTFVTVDEGSTVRRMTIGFGSGASQLTTLVEGYQMTPRGLRKLGSASVEAGGASGTGAVVPAAVAIAIANPIGLIVTTAVGAGSELSGRRNVEARAQQTADAIANRLQQRFREQGWID